MTPLEDFTNDAPATEERANRAKEWLVHHAHELGRAKAEKEKTDHLIKIAEARAFKEASGAVEARKMEARASKRYEDAILEHAMASANYEILYATRIAAEAVINMFQTVSANQRRV